MLKRVERVNERTVLLEFSQPMEVTSTAPVIKASGGFTDIVDGLVFHTVPRDFNRKDILSFYRELLKSVGLERGVVFITAVPVERLRHVALDRSIHVFATVGLWPPACIEVDELFNSYLTISTINIAVVANYPLARSAMADLLRVVAEAKAIASSDSLLRCKSRPSGTITDAIAVLKPFDAGSEILFVGMSTAIGNKVAKAVHQIIVAEAMARGADQVLKDVLGYSMEELIELFLNVYRQTPIPGVLEDSIRRRAYELLARFLKDPNVWSFLVASRELDLHGVSGTITGLSREEFMEDSKKVVADEMLGMSLATYLAGAKAIFSMYWIERLKEGGRVGHWKSGMFEDDIVSALIASLLTLILDEYV